MVSNILPKTMFGWSIFRISLAQGDRHRRKVINNANGEKADASEDTYPTEFDGKPEVVAVQVQDVEVKRAP
ncbi:hypothetical protein D9619_006930 [Psilocybe cf. subviscida]|uniref:Uncharacterized protein n=1 Tax=Psilocybe cf. subviscida TaxID=2480587 RepID=A0A8H5EWH4_9AGAR|nr:hypothetical protein D9619_006930 [Psilocybe cf. subviscida]